MKVLVTGHLGLIGQHLTLRLLKCGHRVVGIDRQQARVEHQHPRVQHFQVDILDRSQLVKCFVDSQPDIVVHLAARTDLQESKNLEGYAANIQGVENVIAGVRAAGSVQRTIYTSTQLVCRVGYQPQHDEDYCPHTLYGESKVQTERIVRQQGSGGVPWCLVRPTTVWGPLMSPHYQRLLNLIQRRRYFHVGRRPLRKSYAYAGNIAFQYERLCTAAVESIHQQVFYLADYEPLILQDWTNSLAKALNSPQIPVMPTLLARGLGLAGDAIGVVKSGFAFNTFRLNNILAEYVFDMSKTRAVCGELPWTMQQGVAETAAWYLGTQKFPGNGSAIPVTPESLKRAA